MSEVVVVFIIAIAADHHPVTLGSAPTEPEPPDTMWSVEDRLSRALARAELAEQRLFRLQSGINSHVESPALRKRLLSTEQGGYSLGTRTDSHSKHMKLLTRARPPRQDDTTRGVGCRDYTAVPGVCNICGGETGISCLAGSGCHAKIPEVCSSAQQLSTLVSEFSYAENYSVCLEAVVCIDCSTAPAYALDQVPCPPSAYSSGNTSRVLLMLDNSPQLNISGAFGPKSNAYPAHLAGISLSNTTVLGGLFHFENMVIGGSFNMTNTLVNGTFNNFAFTRMSLGGNLNLSGIVVTDGITNGGFSSITVGGTFSMAKAHITGGIQRGAFSSATVAQNVNLNGITVLGGITFEAFTTCIIGGDFLFRSATVSGGITRYVFESLLLSGNFDMSNTSVIGGIGGFAFASASIGGNLNFSGLRLSDGGIQPGTFSGATVGGLFTLSRTRFPNDTLPTQLFFGCNAQGGIDLSYCSLVHLDERPCGSGCYSNLAAAQDLNDDDSLAVNESVLEGGPFTGASMPVGISFVTVNLSRNNLTEIKNTSLLGVTATTVDLSYNRYLSIFHPYWFLAIPNAHVIDTTGNPTKCVRLGQRDSVLAEYTFQETATTMCTCGPGTYGTGSFCAASPCVASLAALNKYALGTLGGGVYSAQHTATVPSRGFASLTCPAGKHPNVGTDVHAECLGGAFNPQTNPCVDNSPHRMSAGAIAGIVLGCLVIAAGVGYFLLLSPEKQRARKLARTLHSTEKQTELNERLLDETRGELEEATAVNTRMRGAWKIEERDIRIGEVIASGSFGVVHDGLFAGLRVAIKILKTPLDEDLYPDVGRDFARECETLMAIRHSSLLIFYGAGLTSENNPFMVTEFMTRGSLKRVLLDRQQEVPWPVRYKIATQVAAAMEYLHDSKIVHRDLKSDNCLLNDQLDAKVALPILPWTEHLCLTTECNLQVCDFGTSKFLTSSRPQLQETGFEGSTRTLGLTDALSASMTKGVGTLLWMAPELFNGASKYGPEIDVYVLSTLGSIELM